MELEPAAKKRKLGVVPSFGSQAASSQPSFTEVLERLKEEGSSHANSTSLPLNSLVF